jgi:Ca-activated chloride channel family protein
MQLLSQPYVAAHRSALVLLVALAVFVAPLPLWAEGRDAATRNRDANRAFEETRFEEATDLYDAAQTLEPESGVISYNLGNALYRQGLYEEATSALLRGSIADDRQVRQNSLFNLGNAFVQLEKYPEALTAYRNALQVDPHDLDTKINFEKAMQRLQQQQEQQKQEQQEKGDEQQEGDQQEDQQQDGEQEEQENQDQEGDKQQEQNDSDQEQEKQDSDEEQEQPKSQEEEESQEVQPDSLQAAPGEMTPEEAMRILDAMREQEKELQKEKAKKAQARARGVEKDW